MDGMHSRLKPHGESLMGDSIDPKTGAITFNHTDVSLPGNFELDVSLRRRIAQGPHPYSPFQEGFADWDIDIPIAYSMYGVPNHQHQAPRASGGCMTFSGDAGTTSTVFAGSGSQTRVELDFPDHGEGVVLHIPGAGLSGFPNRNNILSDPKNNWLSAPQTTDFAGRCATVTIAPNGTKYKFGRHAIRSAPVASIPSLFRGSIDTLVALKRNYFVHLITEVEDVNGNWVRYDYTNNGRSELTRIYSSDGRDIRINYRPEVLNPLYDNSRRVESVTANGRRWSYSYDGTALGTTHRLGKLKTATLPDGRYWDFNMNAMHYVPHMGYQCRPYVGTQNLKHPDGATGTFQLRETRHLKSSAGKQRNDFAMVPRDVPHGNAQTHPGCNTAFAANRRPYGLPFYQAMSVAWKRIEGPGIPTATWTFDYHDYTGGQIDTTWSRVTDPYGTQTTRTYRASGDQTTRGVIADSTMGAGHGLLERVDIVPETGAGETIRYEYDLLNNRFRGLFSCLLEVSESAPLGACESFNYRPVTKTVRTRDSDVYTTESTYSKNASDFVDHGYPNIVQRYSNIQGSTTPRIVTKTYKHIKGKNIIGLPAKVTQNGLEVSTYTYDAFGRKTAQTRYGKPYMTFGYHGAAAYKGALHWVRDALGRTTYLLNYKRGTPQQVKRPDNTSHFTYVDNNGWTTSQKDPLGRTTNYTHDNMGRLKTIDPTGNFWSVTAIGYTFPPSGGAVQTITRGSSLTTITYDAMYRATLEHVRDLGSNWQSFVNTKYDALGRTIFTSQPSTNPSETKGVDTTYDGLGRVTQSRENVAPFATTKYSYHGSHRRRTTDPSGAWTDHYGYGYEGPGSDDYRAIYHYADGAYQRYTYLYKNVRGQMTRLRQWGHTQGGLSIDKSQNFYYDAQQRLCRHYVPEHGATKYQYDAAGQMTAYAKGQSNSGCGTVPNSAAKVSLTYDKLGRVTKTDFADAGTPDILKTYDANSNVKTVNRGGVNWTYAYNDYDLLTAETLRLDGRTFPMNYVYNSEGQMTRRKLPTNRWVDYTLDGLGRTTDVTSASVRLASNTNFHTSGAVTAMNYGNGQRFTQTLNARLLPQRMRAVKGSTVALDLDYLYDPRGKITRMTDRQNGNNTRNYKYDGLGQLIEAKAPFWGTASYTYDSLGNIRQKKVGARTIDMIYDAKNRLSRSIDTGETKTRWIAYDARGNTSALGAMKFIYDYADQPVRVTGSAGGIDGAAGTVDGRYTYDGNLKRVKSVVNGKTIYNVYDASGGLLHVHELTGNKKTDYVNGPLGSLARYTNNVVTYLHGDHLGSPRATTNGAGAINGWGALRAILRTVRQA